VSLVCPQYTARLTVADGRAGGAAAAWLGNRLMSWRVVGASVRGTGHERAGLPCQDAHGWRILPEGTLVMVVADGAGSAPFAEVGAEIAVRTALETVGHWALPPPDVCAEWDILLRDVLCEARTAIEKEAVTRAVSPRDFATTFLLAIATSELVAVVQVGDGAVVIDKMSGDLRALTI